MVILQFLSMNYFIISFLVTSGEQMNATQIDGSSTLDEDLNDTITSIEELHLDSSSDCDTDTDEFTKMMCDLCEKCYSDETLLMEHRLLCHGDSLDEYLNGEPTKEMYPEEIVDQLDGYPGSPSEISDIEDKEISHGNSDAEMRDVSEEHQVANVSVFFESYSLH